MDATYRTFLARVVLAASGRVNEDAASIRSWTCSVGDCACSARLAIGWSPFMWEFSTSVPT